VPMLPTLVLPRPSCPPPGLCGVVAIHGPFGVLDLVNPLLGGVFGHGTEGFPALEYPAWDVLTTQQVYYEWVRRAFDHGMKLMVMLAVNNQVLCGLVGHRRDFGCADMPAIDRQIAAAKALEAFIDAQTPDVPDDSWYHIVYSAREARETIAQG